MKRKTKKEKKKSQPGKRLYSMYARSDRGCKGQLAQQVPERSEWSSTKEIVSSETELKQAKREITDLTEKMGYLKNHYPVFTLDEDVLKMEAGLATVLSVMQKGWKIKSITLLAGGSKYLLR